MSDAPPATPHRSHDHTIRIAYRDTDQMGMVYYGNYFTFLEIGRTELLRARGWSYREMEHAGYFLPVIHASCDYLKSARYDDLLRVRTTIDRLDRLRLDFTYEVWCDARTELLARGATRHVFIDRDGRPIRIPADVVRRIAGEG